MHLKKLKTCTSNKEGNERVVLQSDEIMIQLKATNGHAIRNIIFKRWKNIIDATTSNPPKVPNIITPTPIIDSMQELPSTPSSKPFTPSTTFWPPSANTSGTLQT